MQTSSLRFLFALACATVPATGLLLRADSDSGNPNPQVHVHKELKRLVEHYMPSLTQTTVQEGEMKQLDNLVATYLAHHVLPSDADTNTFKHLPIMLLSHLHQLVWVVKNKTLASDMVQYLKLLIDADMDTETKLLEQLLRKASDIHPQVWLQHVICQMTTSHLLHGIVQAHDSIVPYPPNVPNSQLET